MGKEIILLLLEATALYFICINLAYGVLMLLSWVKIKRYKRVLRKSKNPSELPPVSFIIPAFNEESLIVETIQTYLSLPQGKKEIIVINDGSHDKTMKLLQNMFQLKKESADSMIFRSITHPELLVLEAPHMGKSQALNLGVEHASFDLICTMDADTIPHARGISECLMAIRDDKKLVAVGGVIQVLNSKVLKDNSPLKQKSEAWLPSFQRIEYLRTFICERLGWSFLSSTLLISGAFCMIRKDAVKKVGGFSHKSITEDFDLIVRLRRLMRGDNHRFRILPVTTCYTQVPSTMHHLMRQRVRWQLGLVQTLSSHKSLFFHPGYGPLGLFAIPYLWIVEVLSPFLVVLAYVMIPYALYEEIISWEPVVLFLGIGLVFNLFITMTGIYLDNKYVSQNNSWSYFKSIFHTAFLHLGYKQFNSWWRLRANLKVFSRNPSWGEKPREEITHS